MRSAGLVVVWMLLGISFVSILAASMHGPQPVVVSPSPPAARAAPPIRWDWKRIGRLVGRCDALAVSPVGDKVAAGDSVGRLLVWDAAGSLLNSTSGHRGAVTAVTFAHDGDRVASAGAGDLVRLWSLRSGRWSGLLNVESVTALSFSPDDRLLAVADGYGITLADTAGGPVIRLAAKLPALTTALAWDGTGRNLAAAGADGVVRVWDRDGRAVERRPLGIGSLLSVGWTDGTVVASGSEGGLRWWNVTSGDDQRSELIGDRLVTASGELPRMPVSPVAPFRTAVAADGGLIAIASEGEVWIIRP